MQEWLGVDWHEGMLLSAVHFQQQERRMATVARHVAEALHPHPYGFTRCEVDTDALAGGTLTLTACAGIMPDGLAFALPQGGELPASRTIADLFGSDRDRLAIHLAVSRDRPDAVAASDDGSHAGRATRWRRRTQAVRDRSPDGEDTEIVVTLPHVRLVCEGEGLDDQSTLKIGEVVREHGDRFALVEDAVGPCLCLAAAPGLERVVKGVCERLVGRSDEMRRQLRQRTQGVIEFTMSEIANVLAAQAINRALPQLLAWLDAPARAHPAKVHAALAALTAEMLTLRGETRPADLPRYAHDQPFTGIAGVVHALSGVFEGGVSTTRYVPMPLARVNDRVSRASVPETVITAHRIFLAVQSTIPAERVMAEVPVKAKVASAERIKVLIAQALRGIGLTYVAVPPGEIPAQPGHQYFELDCSGPEWDAVVEGGSIAVYMPPDFTDLTLEFLAIRI